MSYTSDDVKKLREETGAGIMDCKKALQQADGNYEKAKAIVRETGMARAEKKADRETKEGYIASYVHATGKTAAMVEVLCETDFVARNDEFRSMAKDLAMQVVAMQPADVAELLAQEFIKNPSQTIEQVVKSLSGKIGEKFEVKRFVRMAVGE